MGGEDRRHGAHDRDRLADERDRRADDRDRRADARDAAADERERRADDLDRRAADVKDRVAELMLRAVQRDLAADRRDLRAAARPFPPPSDTPAIDRFHSSRDRDAAAGDRLTLREIILRILDSPATERPDEKLAEALAATARTLRHEQDVQATLQGIVDLAAVTLDGCEHAAISVTRAGRVYTDAVSGDLPPLVDSIQYEVDEGPCLDAIRQQPLQHAVDLEHDERWPRFAGRAARETGVRSMLSLRLTDESHTLGALNLYSTRVGAFEGQESSGAAALFAAHAGMALGEASSHEQMEGALESRDVIGQAKGILMAQARVSADESFEILRRASQGLNVKLRDLAEELASTGEVPQPPEN